MAQLLVRHKVKDYTKWKPIFDEHSAKRKAGGSKGGRLFRSTSDPNELVILFEWEDVNKARQFSESWDLRQAMDRGGCSPNLAVRFLERIRRR